ncbi:MAG: hypothetical protein AAFV53_14080 [Myxococcota bacterium]
MLPASILLFCLGVLSPAHAGSGPWTLSQGDLDVYVGAESRRTTTLVDGSGAAEPLPGGGVSTIGSVLVGSFGVVPRVEGSLLVPVYRSRSLAEQDPDCQSFGLEACETSGGVGVLSARLKGLIVDELFGPPVSIAVAGEMRLGDLTAPSRARLTALGEGTTDLGLYLSIGRSGGVGEGGLWSVYAEGGYRYRFPNGELNGEEVPGNEWLAVLEGLYGPNSAWMIGPSVYFLTRPQGVDLEDVSLDSPERFVGLSTTAVQAGGKLILRSSDRWSLSLSALRTVVARNSFGDELIISAGVSTWRPARQNL